MIKKRTFILYVISVSIILISSQNGFAFPNTFAGIVQSEKEKVVNISISSFGTSPKNYKNQFFNNGSNTQMKTALGSGILYSSDGYIITSHHVVANADKIEVKLHDGTKYSATIIGKDKRSELALIKIEATQLPFVKWGNSSAVKVGDWVLAIGNPLGLDFTATSGILSGRGRSVLGDVAYGQFLQTDAAINFGNSGGPLFNMKGEVIGINTAIIAGGQNLGFAVPSNLAKKIILQLKKIGKVERGWLGVGIQKVDGELADSFGLPKGVKGIIVTMVTENSPAENAGLEKRDIITEFNGKPLHDVNNLQQFVGETAANTSVDLKVFRKGTFSNVAVTVGLYPSEDVVASKQAGNKLGLQVVIIPPEVRSAYRLEEDYGLLVNNINQTGLGWEKGIRKGDIILESNRKRLNTPDDFSKTIE